MRITHSLVLVIFLVVLNPEVAFSHSVDLGVSESRGVFGVSKGGESDLAKLTNGSRYYPHISLRFKPGESGWNSWGYFLELNAGSFDLHKQDNYEDEVDYGTSISGSFAYFTPTIYYDFLKGEKGANFISGLGFGLGYLEAHGDAILNRGSSNERITIETEDLSYSVGLFFELSDQKWVLRMSAYASYSSDKEYDYSFTDVKAVIARRISW